jgi:hypothetical protein
MVFYYGNSSKSKIHGIILEKIQVFLMESYMVIELIDRLNSLYYDH